MEKQTPLESPDRHVPINPPTPSVAHTRGDSPLPAEAKISSDHKTSDSSTNSNTDPFPTRRESTDILVLLNIYIILLSLAWYLSHYDEPNSTTTLLKPLLACALSILYSRYRNQADKLPVQRDGTLAPWSYESIGNSIAMCTFCRVMISGYFIQPSFNNSDPTEDTSMWLFSSICLLAYYVLSALFIQFNRWRNRPTVMNSAFISELKNQAGIFIMLPLLLFPLPANVQAFPWSYQAVARLPDITTILSRLVSYAVVYILFSLLNWISPQDYRPRNAKSALISSFKILARSLIVVQPEPFIVAKPSGVLWHIESLLQDIVYLHTLVFLASAADFLFYHLYYQPPRSASRLKRFLLLFVAVIAVALSFVKNPYLAPAVYPTRHTFSHA